MGEIAPTAMEMVEMGEKGIKWSSGAQSVGQWVVQDQKNDARGHLFYEKLVFAAVETFTDGTDVKKTLVSNVYRGLEASSKKNNSPDVL